MLHVRSAALLAIALCALGCPGLRGQTAEPETVPVDGVAGGGPVEAPAPEAPLIPGPGASPCAHERCGGEPLCTDGDCVAEVRCFDEPCTSPAQCGGCPCIVAALGRTGCSLEDCCGVDECINGCRDDADCPACRPHCRVGDAPTGTCVNPDGP